MNYPVTVNGILSECNLTEEEVNITSNSASVTIKIEDIIGCEVVPPYFFFRQHALYVWYIEEQGKKLTKASVNIYGDENVCNKLRKDIQGKLKAITKRPKSLLVLINPIGGNKTAQKDYKNTVGPVFKLADIKCDVIVSEREKHMVDIVKEYDLKTTDGIVILGGDGSFTEVVNVLLRKEQEKTGIDIDDPAAEIRPITMPISMIPTGTGNFVAARSTGLKDVLNSTLHVIKGNLSQMNIIGVYADNRLLSYAGVTATYRGFTDMIYYSDSYRWLGRMRYYVIPLWLSFFKPYLKTFEAEITYYGNITEAGSSMDQSNDSKDVLIGGKKLEGVKSRTKDSVVIDGKFKLVGMGNSNFSNELNDQIFITTTCDESMTELQLLKYLKDAISGKKDLTPDFSRSVLTYGIKVKAEYDQMDDGSEDDAMKHLLMIDGEFFKIKELAFQFWLHKSLVPLFATSL